MRHVVLVNQIIGKLERSFFLFLLTLLPISGLASCSGDDPVSSSQPKLEDTTEDLKEQVLLSADANLYIASSTKANKAQPIIHWTWNTGSPEHTPANYDKKKLATIAECKPIGGGIKLELPLLRERLLF